MEEAAATADRDLPLLALAIGDPCGISPELTARLVAHAALEHEARLLVVGDARVLAAGAAVAGVGAALARWSVQEPPPAGHALLDLGNLDPSRIELGAVSELGGRFALENFTTALRLAREGRVAAVTFTPFNKQAMRLARPGYDDEIGVISEALGARSDGREFNVLGALWNARVTSHVPLKDVSDLLGVDAIVRAGTLADRCMREAGFVEPRIGVAGFNPHAGDGGAFGREEIEVIAPAVARMREQGVRAVGPLPADTIFVRARKGEFDAVLTMYHDQGQIAMKLLGFDQGVTLLGGYPVPICTPAHGTAYDIAGKGIADVKAAFNAIVLAARMARGEGVATAPTARAA
ncbi:MAG: 4-hydroxythreonine-4-phosphate dehydrogenase PdxA [Burkholderiaceae bacterium]|nr:4-hydroxythreonine-4-phosphate dehydrogenase PdxA [Burkholderiaceae bacterium]